MGLLTAHVDHAAHRTDAELRTWHVQRRAGHPRALRGVIPETMTSHAQHDDISRRKHYTAHFRRLADQRHREAEVRSAKTAEVTFGL